MIPIWLQWVLSIAAALTAIGVIWGKFLKPMARLITTTEEMLPLLNRLTVEFKDTPDAFKVLKEIQGQFRSDSGSTLKDQVNRLEAAAEKQEVSARVQEQNAHALKVAVETAAQRAGDDREHMQRLILALDRLSVKLEALTIKVDETIASGNRIEQHASAVAVDLAQAHKRADKISDSAPGAAADAAAQQSQKEKRDEQESAE